MSPKSGKAGSAVTPADPKTPQEADVADPGEVEKIKAEQQEKKKGKYGAESTKPHKATDDDQKKKTSWIELKMVGEDGKPVTGEAYRVTLPDDTTAEGTLDEKGIARIEAIEPGTCRVTFTNLDKSAWEEL
jgi:hypothetical protein